MVFCLSQSAASAGPVKKIFIGGVAHGTSEEDIRQYFSRYGTVSVVWECGYGTVSVDWECGYGTVSVDWESENVGMEL